MPVPHDTSEITSPASRWVPIVAGAVFLGLAIWGASSLMGKSDKKAAGRQTVKIAVLPDTPPPPPPPPKEDKPEPPKDEPKQAVQTEQPKRVETPPQAAEALKMDGPAGDGPSAFQAGSITNEYRGGPVGGGSAAAPSASDRAKFNFYARSAQQLLKSELDRTLPKDIVRLGARLQIWVGAQGRIERFEVLGLSDRQAEERVRSALNDVSRGFRLVPPPGLPQPMELRLSVDPISG